MSAQEPISVLYVASEPKENIIQALRDNKFSVETVTSEAGLFGRFSNTTPTDLVLLAELDPGNIFRSDPLLIATYLADRGYSRIIPFFKKAKTNKQFIEWGSSSRRMDRQAALGEGVPELKIPEPLEIILWGSHDMAIRPIQSFNPDRARKILDDIRQHIRPERSGSREAPFC